jgi:HlyD family secretion protein
LDRSVSGPIVELHGEFNQEVTKDELLARVDPRIYDAALRQQPRLYKTRQAEVARAKAQLQQAINDEKRRSSFATRIPRSSPKPNSTSSPSPNRRSKRQLRAGRSVRRAGRRERRQRPGPGRLHRDQVAVDGIIINRKIDRGQTLAAQFRTPELFIIAPEMKGRMHIHASVDEADIGLIRAAKLENLPVKFTIDAYPDDLFEGHIEKSG